MPIPPRINPYKPPGIGGLPQLVVAYDQSSDTLTLTSNGITDLTGARAIAFSGTYDGSDSGYTTLDSSTFVVDSPTQITLRRAYQAFWGLELDHDFTFEYLEVFVDADQIPDASATTTISLTSPGDGDDITVVYNSGLNSLLVTANDISIDFTSIDALAVHSAGSSIGISNTQFTIDDPQHMTVSAIPISGLTVRAIEFQALNVAIYDWIGSVIVP